MPLLLASTLWGHPSTDARRQAPKLLFRDHTLPAAKPLKKWHECHGGGHKKLPELCIEHLAYRALPRVPGKLEPPWPQIHGCCWSCLRLPARGAPHWSTHQKNLILKMSPMVLCLMREWYPVTDCLRKAVEVKGNYSPSFTQFSCIWLARG